MMTIMNAKQASSQYFNGTLSYWRLLELAKAGQIPHFKVGSRVFFRRESLDLWITGLETAEHPKTGENEVRRLVGRN